MRLLLLGVVFCLIVSPAFSNPPLTIAVLDFENHSLLNAESYGSLTSGLAQMMISTISPIESLTLVERQRLQTILDEIKLDQAGVTDSGAASSIGQLAGAKYLVFGAYMVVPGDKIRIDVRIVEVETGLTLLAEEVTGKTKQILKLVKKLSEKLVKELAVSLTKEELKLLQQSQDVPMQAILDYSEGLQLEDKKSWKAAGACYLKALKTAPKFELAHQRARLMAEKVKNPN